MDTEITLQCWLHGLPDSIFAVKVALDENISGLKSKVKEGMQLFPPPLNDIPALSLDIWKASIPFDSDRFEQKIEEIVAQRRPLISRTMVSTLFRDEMVDNRLEKDRLHIIVKATGIPGVPLELNCLVHGEAGLGIFPVKILSTESVGTLRYRIKEARPRTFNNFDASSIWLWQVSIVNNKSLPGAIDALNLTDETSLSPTDILSHIFRVRPFPGHVHILAKRPTIQQEIAVDEGGKRTNITTLERRQENNVADIKGAPNPSRSARSSTYPKSQVAYALYDGRYPAKEPRSTVAPTIQLFHPVFGHFLDDTLNRPIIPNDDMVRKTTRYMKDSSAIYNDETERMTKLKVVLEDILGFTIEKKLNADNTHPDGVIEVIANKCRMLLLLEEDKNEFGDGGSDPSTQAGLSAARRWAQPEFDEVRKATSCPTFLLATAGPWLAVLGFVMIDCVIVQRLTDFIWVGLDAVHSEQHITRIATIFSALKISLEKLAAYYRNLELPLSIPDGSRFFPSITTYGSPNKSVKFKYLGYLENGLDCIAWRAQTCDEEPVRDIVVKFVTRYGKEAHELLATAKLAPRLIYCGSPHVEASQPTYGYLQMVVMEYVEGRTLGQVLDEGIDDARKEEIKAKVREALELLHRKKLVHGDLRPPNVMITNINKVKLIDFDWTGEEGKVKYPYLIAEHGPMWASGVSALAPIKHTHDMEMLERLFV